jgi:diguanylate cyclase (GGDEF)-like protein
MQDAKHSDAHRHREHSQHRSAPTSRGQHRSDFSDSVDWSERDTLTGLLNRKTFDESFLKATVSPSAALTDSSDARNAADASAGCWLGMIDTDHVKRANDDSGHLIGDEVLLLPARLIRSSFRSHDQRYRFGGEEFVVLMRCGSDVDAALAFERTDKAVHLAKGHGRNQVQSHADLVARGALVVDQKGSDVEWFQGAFKTPKRASVFARASSCCTTGSG